MSHDLANKCFTVHVLTNDKFKYLNQPNAKQSSIGFVLRKEKNK